jgi:hypothetical protein
MFTSIRNARGGHGRSRTTSPDPSEAAVRHPPRAVGRDATSRPQGLSVGALVGWLYNGLAAPSKTVPHNAEDDR